MKFNEMDLVRVLKDFPEQKIKKGDIGIIITVFTEPREGYEVEFDDGAGKTKAVFSILPEYLEAYC